VPPDESSAAQFSSSSPTRSSPRLLDPWTGHSPTEIRLGNQVRNVIYGMLPVPAALIYDLINNRLRREDGVGIWEASNNLLWPDEQRARDWLIDHGYTSDEAILGTLPEPPGTPPPFSRGVLRVHPTLGVYLELPSTPPPQPDPTGKAAHTLHRSATMLSRLLRLLSRAGLASSSAMSGAAWSPCEPTAARTVADDCSTSTSDSTEPSGIPPTPRSDGDS
jgi:hypothetical protein